MKKEADIFRIYLNIESKRYTIIKIIWYNISHKMLMNWEYCRLQAVSSRNRSVEKRRLMKIAFYSTKPYDRIYFEPKSQEYDIKLDFYETSCKEETIPLAKGHDAICIFVNDHLNATMLRELKEMGIIAVLLRCAGYNNVDIKAANECGIPVLRVPSYSPEAVAEFAAALLLTVNRYTHRAYTRTRDFNMSINGFMGMDLHGKTAGVIGTGRIGQAMIRILKGFGMKIIAYDPYLNDALDIEYDTIENVFEQADVVTLHCPLTPETKHIVQAKTIEMMKDGVYLINTSRGDLIRTEDLIEGLLAKKFGGVGLDVYDEECGVFYEDCSNDIMEDPNLARVTTFPNVLVTSHMGFFTKEAVEAIAEVTLNNADAVRNGRELENAVQI